MSMKISAKAFFCLLLTMQILIGCDRVIRNVRLNPGSDTLFIKASGITAAFSQPQTWLFEYDLNSRKQIAHNRVDPSVLPEECKIE